MAKSTSITVLL